MRIRMHLRVLFTQICKFHTTPHKESNRVTKVSKWQIKVLIILVFITIFCMYRLKTVNIDKERYILIWGTGDYYPFNAWKMGRESFIEDRCPFTNCFIVSNKNMDEPMRMFDAVAFHGRDLFDNLSDVPKERYDHQKYIYFNMESADNYPVCHPRYDGFFNWTATYRLDSEIVDSYILIKNGAGEEIGPKSNMKWPDAMSESSDSVAKFHKTRAVAWFVSNCVTRSKRELYAAKLKHALKKYNLNIDVYGNCGSLQCDGRFLDCNKLLNNYYFYLSFENTFAEDYVTEKLNAPLQNNNVPIVYGGANYSRFLPPGSYLDARKLSPKKMAATIARLIANPEEYEMYLRRRYHYIYTEPLYMCRLCAALNNETLMQKRHVYEKLRHWWHPDYEKRCQSL